MLPNLYHCSKKLKSSLYRLAYSDEPLQKAVMCFVTWLSLDACPHPWLSCHPPLLHSHAGTGTRARVFLWWFPAVPWALVRSCSVTKGLWPVKEEATWAILVMTPEPKECYSKIHIKYCWMSSLSWGSLTQLEKVWHVPSIGSPMTWWWPEEPRPLHLHELHSYSRVKSSQELKDVRYSNYHWALGKFRHWRYMSLRTSVQLLFMTEIPRMAQNSSFPMNLCQRKRKNAFSVIKR